MSRRVPLNSPEGRRLVEQGPPWREDPDYYAEEPDDLPMRGATQQDAREAAARMKAWADGTVGMNLVLDLVTDEEWLNLARVALELRPR